MEELIWLSKAELECISYKIVEGKIYCKIGGCFIRPYTQRKCRLDITCLKIIKYVSESIVITFLYTVIRVDTCDSIGEIQFLEGGTRGECHMDLFYCTLCQNAAV